MGLHFLVIGAQKAGTTTLWQLLRDHPQLWLPETKEAPFFSHTDVYRRGLPDYLRRLGVPTGEERTCGTVTPHYMHGWRDAGTPTVAARIARQLPDVRLIALLRDPIARARSQHAMALARRREARAVDDTFVQLLRERELRDARAFPHDTNSYIVQGEYGRILGDYLGFFERSALHIEYSHDLQREPLAVLRRILCFLSVRPDFKPPAPFLRSFAGGGQARVPDGELLELLRLLDAAPVSQGPQLLRAWTSRHAIDGAGEEELEGAAHRYFNCHHEFRSRERAGLEFFLRKIWNVKPSPPPPLSPRLRAALEAHFAADAQRLLCATGLHLPWSQAR